MVNNSNPNEPVPIKSLEKTFQIIDVLQQIERGTLTEIAEYGSLSKSTAHKHLASLAAYGYVVREDDKYRLGFRFLDVGGHVRSLFPGAAIIKKKVQELANETNETVQYMTEERGRTVVLYREDGRDGVPSRTRTGTRMDVNQTASGKVILSQLPDERVEEIIDTHGLPPATDATITDRDELFEELEQIRERGVAYNYGESTKGLYAISAPMMDPDNNVIGACTVSGPSHRMHDEKMKSEIKSTLLSIINEIELNIAHS